MLLFVAVNVVVLVKVTGIPIFFLYLFKELGSRRKLGRGGAFNFCLS